ncbi:MAG: CBS domain-containing protein [Solirubrobacterales bacterium]
MTAPTPSQDMRRRSSLPSFERGLVGDVMRMGVMSAPPDAPLRSVAATMADFGVHSVVVTDLEQKSGEDRAWGIVTDADLMEATPRDLDGLTARDCAATELVSVTYGETLQHAAQLMAEHDITHLLVVDPETGRPIGMISSLDIAAVIAHG